MEFEGRLPAGPFSLSCYVGSNTTEMLNNLLRRIQFNTKNLILGTFKLLHKNRCRFALERGYLSCGTIRYPYLVVQIFFRSPISDLEKCCGKWSRPTCCGGIVDIIYHTYYNELW